MRSYQRPHIRSPRAIDKPYRFVELPLLADVDVLATLLEGVEPSWQPSQWKWHRGTFFCVLRGGPAGDGPAGELTTGKGVDTPWLDAQPLLRRWIDGAFPEPPTVAWLGSSPRGAVIRAHVDNTPQWDEHHRVHVPLVTSPRARLCVQGRFLHLRRGAAWLLNNSVVHGAYNGGPPRTHLIVDLPDSPRVRAWIEGGTPRPGSCDPVALQALEQDPLCDLSVAERADRPLLERMRCQ